MDKQLQQKIAAFFSSFSRREFEKGKILIHPEERISDVYYIVQGQVVQYDISPSDSEVVVNVYKPRGLFPMAPAINGTPNHYFFEAVTNVVAHQVPAKKAALFVRQNPDVMFHLLQGAYYSTDGILQRMSHLTGGDVRSRLLFELFNASQRLGRSNALGEINTALTEIDIAKRSNLPREVVSRTMRELKESGLVGMQGRAIVVRDIKRLESVLGLDR